MDENTSGVRCCEVCGGPVQQNNTAGICRTTPECSRERTRRSRAANGPGRRQKQECSRPDCTKFRSSQGVCAMHYERFKRTGDYGPAESLVKAIAVNPGDSFGHWTALESYIRPKRRILCRCTCGAVTDVDVYSLINDLSKSCGCERSKEPRAAGEPYMRPGEVYGRLTVLESAAYAADMIRFRCECGTETVKRARFAKVGTTKSCGCLRLENFQTHGLSRHPLYHIWRGILRRCENPKDAAYEKYGAAGITVCEGWHGLPGGFLSFAADLGERPPRHTVDRLNNDGGYWCGHCAECVTKGRPANAAWRTPKQQNANRRTVLPLVRERDALAAELAALKAQIADGLS
jgi:hypothetical protein